jgi:DNA-directed RNA polymerase specialized sigma24 family protein
MDFSIRVLRLTIPERDKNERAHERFHHPHPRVQQRMWPVWLKGEDFSHQDIARALGITHDTVLS